MYLETAELRAFVTLANELHFGRAAKRVFLSQPALSRQIRRLEEKVGGLLFARTRRKVELTEAGRVLFAGAEKVLQEADRAFVVTKYAIEGRAGALRIGFGIASVFEILPRTILRFRRNCPLVELQMRDMPTPSQIDSLLDGRIDIGIVRLPVIFTELDSIPLLRERFVTVTPESIPYSAREGLASLRNTPFILFDRSVSSTFHDRALALCRRAGFAPHVVQVASEIFTILNLVRAGLGVSLVPSAAIRMRVPGVRFHELRMAEAEWPIGIAWNRLSEKRNLIARFTAIARAIAKQLPGSRRG